MTRAEAQAFINAFVELRNMITDEQALKVPNLYPTWKEIVDYKKDERVIYHDILYKVITPHTSQIGWEPDVAVSLFTKVLIPDENVIPEWERPDSTNTYSKGDKVAYNGKIWISIADNNSWEPGIYGWEEVIE